MRNVLAVFAISILLLGCTTNYYTGEREASKAGKGAGIGAAIGAVAGVRSGDDADEGRKRALLGAGEGALASAGVGAYMDRQEAELREELQGTGVSVTRVGDDIILGMPGNIAFDVNQAALNSSFYPVLNSVAKVAKGTTTVTLPVWFRLRRLRHLGFDCHLGTPAACRISLTEAECRRIS